MAPLLRQLSRVEEGGGEEPPLYLKSLPETYLLLLVFTLARI